MAGICVPFDPALNFSNFDLPLGISLLLALRDTSLRSTGRRERCILSCNYVRHVAISRSFIRTHSQAWLIECAHLGSYMTNRILRSHNQNTSSFTIETV